MTKVETIGTVKNGVLTIVNRQRFQQELQDMKDCDVNVTIKKKGKRGTQFNRYYWGCILKEIQTELRSRGTKVSIEDLHIMMQMAVGNTDKILDEHGTVVLEIPKGTSTMNHGEFDEYTEEVKMWASNTLEIYIPNPNEQAQIWNPVT